MTVKIPKANTTSASPEYTDVVLEAAPDKKSARGIIKVAIPVQADSAGVKATAVREASLPVDFNWDSETTKGGGRRILQRLTVPYLALFPANPADGTPNLVWSPARSKGRLKIWTVVELPKECVEDIASQTAGSAGRIAAASQLQFLSGLFGMVYQRPGYNNAGSMEYHLAPNGLDTLTQTVPPAIAQSSSLSISQISGDHIAVTGVHRVSGGGDVPDTLVPAAPAWLGSETDSDADVVIRALAGLGVINVDGILGVGNIAETMDDDPGGNGPVEPDHPIE